MGRLSVWYYLMLVVVFVVCATKSIFLCLNPIAHRIAIPSAIWGVMMWLCVLALGVLFPVCDSFPEFAFLFFGPEVSMDFLMNLLFGLFGVFLLLILWQYSSGKRQI